jgi:hypothetical protein
LFKAGYGGERLREFSYSDGRFYVNASPEALQQEYERKRDEHEQKMEKLLNGRTPDNQGSR